MEQIVYNKLCYIDGIIKNRFNGHSLKQNLVELTLAQSRNGWNNAEILEFLAINVEMEAKSVSYLNSMIGYIYGWIRAASL